jgi:hypothetical protein
MTPLELSEMMLLEVASLTIIILTILEVSFTLIEDNYSTSITHDNCHLQSSYLCCTGHWFFALFSVYIFE